MVLALQYGFPASEIIRLVLAAAKPAGANPGLHNMPTLDFNKLFNVTFTNVEDSFSRHNTSAMLMVALLIVGDVALGLFVAIGLTVCILRGLRRG
jgi:hypothetical protein